MAGWLDGLAFGFSGCLQKLLRLIIQRSTIRQFNHQAIEEKAAPLDKSCINVVLCFMFYTAKRGLCLTFAVFFLLNARGNL
jgi:hypothetical protein